VFKRNRHGVKAGLNFSDIRSIAVPVPPVELQSSFANRIIGAEKLAAQLHSALNRVETLFASLQHRAFRGDL